MRTLRSPGGGGALRKQTKQPRSVRPKLQRFWNWNADFVGSGAVSSEQYYDQQSGLAMLRRGGRADLDVRFLANCSVSKSSCEELEIEWGAIHPPTEADELLAAVKRNNTREELTLARVQRPTPIAILRGPFSLTQTSSVWPSIDSRASFHPAAAAFEQLLSSSVAEPEQLELRPFLVRSARFWPDRAGNKSMPQTCLKNRLMPTQNTARLVVGSER
jgi:hypothetical protein